jgi:hypothetical protein
MKEKLHNNERYLKELSDQHIPTPPPMVWDEIEQVLDKDKDKRRSFIILWIIGIITFGVVLFIFIGREYDKDDALVQQEMIAQDDQKQRNSNKKNIDINRSETSNEVNQETVTNSAELLQSSAYNQEGGKIDTAIEQNTNISKNQKQIDPNIINFKTEITETVNALNQRKNTNASAIPQSSSPNKEESKVSSEKFNLSKIQKYPSKKTDRSTADQSIQESINTINSNESSTVIKDVTSNSTLYNQETEAINEDKRVIIVAVLPIVEWKLLTPIRDTPVLYLNERWTSELNSGSKETPSQATLWFVQLGVGIGSNLSNSVSTDATQGAFRLDTERKWYAWSASLQLGYELDNRWYTSVGINLNQTKHRFDLLRRDVSSLLIGAGQNLQITTGDFFNTGETRYTYADIGIYIGKRININKWQCSLEGGPIFNTLFQANGKVQVEDLEFSRLENQEDYFNTQVGIGAQLSAMVDYPISDQLWISMGPTYHQYFNTVSSNNNPLEERSAILQLKTVIRYYF